MNQAAIDMTSTEMVTTKDPLATALVGLEPDSATVLEAAFREMFGQAREWTVKARAIVVTSEDQKPEMAYARASRLALKAIRVNAEKTKKRLKEDGLRRAKAIDGLYNIIADLIVPLEDHLQLQEDFGKRAEAARKSALRDARAEALRALGADPTVYADLGATSDETWTLTLENARAAHEAKLEAARQAEAVRIEAERIATERRAAEKAAAVKAEAERVEREHAAAEENARLRAEAAEREAAAKVEREAAEAKLRAERKASEEREAEARRERETVEAQVRAGREAAEAEARKAREEADRIAAELAATKAAAEREAKERAEVEAARVAAETEAKAQAALAPDREKLAAVARALRAIELPQATTEKGQAAMTKVAEQLEKMAAWVAKTGAALT